MGCRIFPTSHARRGYGARIGRSAYAVAERRRRLEASHGQPHLPASHARRGYGARIGRSAYAVAERRRRLEASHGPPHLSRVAATVPVPKFLSVWTPNQ
jgi:hypothetical protein